MRIQQLHYIIKIVETGSMNEAAKQLFITQPSLSNAVRDLEREMGIDIFIRNPKGITLTKDGVEFLSYARQWNKRISWKNATRVTQKRVNCLVFPLNTTLLLSMPSSHFLRELI